VVVAAEINVLGMQKNKVRTGRAAAKKLSRVNQNDVEMAKAPGFRPDTLVHLSPHPKQR
jgi:hypothetical protein